MTFIKGKYQGFGLKKGNILWNKGLKGIHLSPNSEFKKGNISPLKGKKRPEFSGEKHPQWRGGGVELFCLKRLSF